VLSSDSSPKASCTSCYIVAFFLFLYLFIFNLMDKKKEVQSETLLRLENLTHIRRSGSSKGEIYLKTM
jgi:hypothetical protein